MVRNNEIRKIEVTRFDAGRLRRLIRSGGYPERPRDPWRLRLRSLLDQARIVSPDQVKPGTVTMNSRVRLQDEISREEMILTLLFPISAKSQRPVVNEYPVSILSPIGLKVFGRHVGDTIVDRITIAEMLYQPEAEGDYES